MDSSVNLFSLCTKVHVYFFPTASGTWYAGTGGTWYGWYVGTGGTLVRIRPWYGGTVHKLYCGYIKVSIFFSAGTYQPCSSCMVGTLVRWYMYWYMYVGTYTTVVRPYMPTVNKTLHGCVKQ